MPAEGRWDLTGRLKGQKVSPFMLLYKETQAYGAAIRITYTMLFIPLREHSSFPLQRTNKQDFAV